MFKKTLCALLASLMLTGALISCSVGSDETEDTKKNDQNDTVEESDTREPLDIPATRYDGTELCLLVRARGPTLAASMIPLLTGWMYSFGMEPPTVSSTNW